MFKVGLSTFMTIGSGGDGELCQQHSMTQANGSTSGYIKGLAQQPQVQGLMCKFTFLQQYK